MLKCSVMEVLWDIDDDDDDDEDDEEDGDNKDNINNKKKKFEEEEKEIVSSSTYDESFSITRAIITEIATNYKMILSIAL